MKRRTNTGRKRVNAILGTVAGLLLALGTQAGCDSHVSTRLIVVPGAGSAATHPEAVGCAEACLQGQRTDPRGAAACLDTCPGAWTAWFDSCEDAPPGSGCYVLVTETLTPSPDKIFFVIAEAKILINSLRYH